MTRIFKAVKQVHSDTIDRHFKIKRRILLAVFASILISLFPPSQAFYLLQAFHPLQSCHPLQASHPFQVFASDADTVTLDEALRLALARDPGVVSARNALEVASLRLVAAESLRFPALTLNASPLKVSWEQSRPLFGPVPEEVWSRRVSSGIGLGATLPIGDGNAAFSIQGAYSKVDSQDPTWDNGWQVTISLPILGKSSVSTGGMGLAGATGAGGNSYKDQVRLAKTAARNAEFELDRAIAKARTSLETAYHGVIRDMGKLEAARMNLERMKQHFAIVEARYAQGNAGDLDLIDAQQGVKSAEIAVDAASHALIVSKMSLNRLIGRDLNEPLALEPVGEYVKEPLLSLDDYISLALSHRQEPVLLEDNLTNAKIELDKACSGLLPQVSFRGSLSDDGSWSIGVDLSKVLPRDYAAELSVKTAENTVVTARQNLAETKEAIVMEVTSMYYALLEAEAYLDLAKSALEKASASAGIRETQYKAGAATCQDVALSIAALCDAEIDLANAEANCFAARARLVDAVGAK
jgi:outer membrane protein TolC